MKLLNQIKARIKKRDNAVTKSLYITAKAILTLDIRPVFFIHKPIHILLKSTTQALTFIIKIFYLKPVFLMDVSNKPKRLRYEGFALPFRIGPLEIQIGDDCRIDSRIALSGRLASPTKPTLTIGNNVGIGWRTGIYVGKKIVIGNNVRIAENCNLSGYAGHPLDAKERAAGKPDTDAQVKDIVLEDDVWLGRGSTVNGGVTIGARTVVCAGSVVTKDLPPDVLAGGVPARVIRHLNCTKSEAENNLEVVYR